jgi:hypothetical protein
VGTRASSAELAIHFASLRVWLYLSLIFRLRCPARDMDVASDANLSAILLTNDAIAAQAIKGHRASVAARRAKTRKRTADLLPVIQSIQATGASSLRQIADVLNERGIRTARGCEWSAIQVNRILMSRH